MDYNDLINGLFETGGAFAILVSILKIYRNKSAQGIHWFYLAFFSSWGVWNIYYYPSLDQWFSFAAGVVLCTLNIVYLVLVIKYSRSDYVEQLRKSKRVSRKIQATSK